MGKIRVISVGSLAENLLHRFLTILFYVHTSAADKMLRKEAGENNESNNIPLKAREGFPSLTASLVQIATFVGKLK